MDRRTFFVGGGFAPLLEWRFGPVSAQYVDNAWLKSPPKRPLAPADVKSAVSACEAVPWGFDPAYVENVIIPYFLVSIYEASGRTCR